jgi:hypothetical protein
VRGGWTYKRPILRAIAAPSFSVLFIWRPRSSFHGSRARVKSTAAEYAKDPKGQLLFVGEEKDKSLPPEKML